MASMSQAILYRQTCVAPLLSDSKTNIMVLVTSMNQKPTGQCATILSSPPISSWHQHPQRRLKCSSRILLCVLLIVHLLVTPCQSQDSFENDEYLREILEEERRMEEEYMGQQNGGGGPDSYYSGNHQYVDPEEDMLRAEAARKMEEERIAHDQAERVRLQREAEFEAELVRMNKEQQKAAKRQKRKDARVVGRVLRAARNERHYAVLGLRSWELRILGRWTLLRADTRAIKRAYRNRAMAVHPDKNRDGRANEAFIAVENSASILTNESLREEYDVAVKAARQLRRQEVRQVVSDGTELVQKGFGRVMWVFRRVLGPFATPIIILGCLLI